ncbi:sodium/glutamate symporter [Paraburkholderia sp. Ac-20336]|uniref:sodium/glutamate symporter n=1 Tax=Paraburkholderia sp. Ac-20336 TaxID=2703886 RepID=UPI001980735D|nr:sodium/glutamate symporter [Paraburkholderia sp. Ac-20336]MBN3804635.1 sodium/glutamate symporter [Paraburkholderia sp. Ac-20336]
MTIGVYATLVATSLVLLLGEKLIQWIGVLRTYSIPAPVAGGLVVAVCVLLIRVATHVEVRFDSTLQAPLMLAFFSTIGLNAHISNLKAGGPVLIRFLALVSGLLILQNVIGILLAFALGVDPLYGILGGSVTMSGGHGTGAAWSQVFSEHHGLQSATEIAIGCATFGLVMGGVLGGPIARLLMRKIGGADMRHIENHDDDTLVFEAPKAEQPTTPAALITTLTLISLCLAGGEALGDWLAGTVFELPTFVCVLFVGVILNNVLSLVRVRLDQHAVALVGNVSLALFLAMALMRLDLWELAALAVPVITILAAQTLLMALYAVFVTFPLMGRSYDAVVLSAAHCGLGLGATPTAIANMQAITNRFGHSHIAFLVVPMTGAFFMDIVNAIVIKLFLALPFFH